MYIREYLIDCFFDMRGGYDALIDIAAAFKSGYTVGILSKQQIHECINYIWNGEVANELTLKATLQWMGTTLDKTNEGFVNSLKDKTDLQKTIMLARLNALGLNTRGMITDEC